MYFKTFSRIHVSDEQSRRTQRCRGGLWRRLNWRPTRQHSSSFMFTKYFFWASRDMNERIRPHNLLLIHENEGDAREFRVFLITSKVITFLSCRCLDTLAGCYRPFDEEERIEVQITDFITDLMHDSSKQTRYRSYFSVKRHVYRPAPSRLEFVGGNERLC